MINKQDYANFFEQNIDIVQGDTLAFNFSIVGLDGDTPTFKMVVKEHYDDLDPLCTAESGQGIELVETAGNTNTYSVHFDPVQTENIKLGRFYYDLKMYVNGDTLTLMRGRFSVLYRVG